MKPVGYKWVFIWKWNEKNEIVRYKAQLVAQGFSQRPEIVFDETYSLVMDASTFWYLISLVAHEGLNLHMMNAATTYLYGSLDSELYMKLPEGFNIPDAHNSESRESYSISLNKSLYGLKQSGWIWYNRYLLREGYTNNSNCSCIFIKRSGKEFAIIVVYMDDINIIGTPEELPKAMDCLKKEFEMNDLRKTKLCLGLQIEHLDKGIFIHQEGYIEKALKCFYMDKCHPLSTPMVVRSLDAEKYPFRPREKDEELLGPEVPYLNGIGAVMYIANYTRPDISFAVNLLSRYKFSPTQRHWSRVKHILHYLRGTIDMGLFYTKVSRFELTGYVDVGYLSDPHNVRSQTNYLFTCEGTTISWRSVK